ncbi:hypothetical protein PAXRUDRAFT_22716 [Paxillus rubicundulus Ve08.2h10]|uniref:Uncharacterized protein n=1 Tax=Paxillus rubicundulus Ve08.2h10 TaxID=930991 RepID=A0A0D0BJP4_9AGAM|nr:hypothetical protein PAXRUDRAFT_22716 [Paxillus rubicundulus Ve08.2h10]
MSQSPTTCRVSACGQNHIVVNGPPVDSHLFAYRHKGGHRPLTKSKFTASLSSAAKKAGIKPFQGHSIDGGQVMPMLSCPDLDTVHTSIPPSP